MKRKHTLILLSVLLCLFSWIACSTEPAKNQIPIHIRLSDDTITADGKAIEKNPAHAVYLANDIIYYETGKDFTYGEGTEQDAHTEEEALAHTVVHITKSGTYRLSGSLSLGQIAIDLGEDAKEDPEAVVTLILDNANITCTVAPAILFYRVYECDGGEKATKDVDTAKAGANVILADGSTNTVKGSYVARIYKPDSVVLNEDQTEVEDAKKLHKYDGAFYSKMSLNINGGEKGDGVLNLIAENEGLGSERHLTVGGGILKIRSGNDGINTNEDGISVTTIGGGEVNITVTGETGEGDGIDSNGWLVINGGTVKAFACSESADAGIDSDQGIYINGGTVIATGSMLDRIETGGQTYAVFQFAEKQNRNTPIALKQGEKTLLETTPENAFSLMIYSAPQLTEGTYTLWSGSTQLAGQKGISFGGGMRPEGGKGERPENFTPPEGERPNGFTPPEGVRPEDFTPLEPEGAPESLSPEFLIGSGANYFQGIQNRTAQ